MAITDITKPMALDETLQATNGKMDSVISELQGIKNALMLDPSIYHPAGTKTCAELVSSLLIEDNLGDVYNITDSGYTTADFIEGAGKPIYAGDNVSIADFGTGGQHVYKFDLLAGIIDLSNYVQKSNTPGLLKNDGSVDETEYATADDLEGVSDDVDVIKERMDADTTSISGNPISISGLKSNQLAVNPIITLEPIQAGSGTPSPSNVRAISGYDKIEVLSCGKNLFDVSKMMVGMYDQDNWHMNDNTLYRSYRLRLKAGTYVFSSSEQLQMVRKVVNGVLSTISGYTSYVLTVDSDAEIGLSFQRPSSQAWGTTPNIQLEESTSATTYVPYHKSTSISESLGQTVYWGRLDVRTGEFEVLGKIVDLGSIVWARYSTTSIFHNATLLSDQKINSAIICDSYNGVNKNIPNLANGEISAISTGFSQSAKIGIRDDNYTDADAFRTSLNGKYAVYELATPFTIQLTPHEISLLKDYAYVSTNGTTIALDYHNGELASLADVSQLGETVNELGEYTARNNLGSQNAIQIPESGDFVCPSDGYIVVRSGNNASDFYRVDLYGNKKVSTNRCVIKVNSTTDSASKYQIYPVYVRKGMIAHFEEKSSGNTNGAAYFVSLE